MPDDARVPYRPYTPQTPALQAAEAFRQVMQQRRSVRDFADTPVPRDVIESIVAAATTAPSGANKQPWRFVCVADPQLKRRIREAAEAEERAFYEQRAPDRWLNDLKPLHTDAHKPYLETAPWLIAVFKLTQTDDGQQVYYPNESVGLACGLLLAAAQHAGLATLTHTPSPMKFLAEVLGRPDHERAYLLIPVGYPAPGCTVPTHATTRRPLPEACVVHE